MPSCGRWLCFLQRALLLTIACFWLAARRGLAQCDPPVIQSVTFNDSASRISVTLVNASAPTPNLVLYYLTESGTIGTAVFQNGSSGIQFTVVVGLVPRVVVVAVHDSEKPAKQSWTPGETIVSRNAVVVHRLSASSEPPQQGNETAKFVEAFKTPSCSVQMPIYLSASSVALKLCDFAGLPQYAAVNNIQSACPKVIINEMSVGPAGQYVELYVEGGSNIDLSGHSLVLFNASANSSVFVGRLNYTTNLFGFVAINATAFLPAATVMQRTIIAVYAKPLSSNAPLNLTESSNRTGIVAALAFGSGNAADGRKDKLLQTAMSLVTGADRQTQIVWLGRSQNEAFSLSYCLFRTGVSGSLVVRFMLSPSTPAAANNCTGVPADASRKILQINEFNADIPGHDAVGNLTEYVELALVKPAQSNFSLANYYIVLYQASSTKAYRVFSLDAVVVSPRKLFVLLGTIDVCGQLCDVTMIGNTIVNSIGAIAVHYREEGAIDPDGPASLDGLVDAYVYTADSGRTLASDWLPLARLLGIGEGSGDHIIYEDETAFVFDESIGLCDGSMQLMPLTPGTPNDCSLSLPASRSNRTGAAIGAGLQSLVYINEWQPTADGRSNHVELVGPPNTAIGILRLVASAWDVSTGAVSRTSAVLKLSESARLSSAGLYSLSAADLDRLSIVPASPTSSEAEAAIAYGNGSRLAYRLTLAAAANVTPVWQSKEKLVPLDAVAVASPADVLLRSKGELLALDLRDIQAAASRCRLNASSPASSAANSRDFDVRPVTRNATNSCPAPLEVLINEVVIGTDSDYVELIVRGASTSATTISLEGFVLVFWHGTDGAVAASFGLSQRLPQAATGTDQLVVVDGLASLAVGHSYVLAVYYDYSFLYPRGAAASTSSRLQDSVGISTVAQRTPLPDSLVDIFRLLYPNDVATFYAQGVVSLSKADQRSFSRCPGNRDHAVDAFELTAPTRGRPNTVECTSHAGESITVKHCLQRKFLRISELVIGDSGFVELASTEPSATPDLPLTDLWLVFYWASASSNWSILNSSNAQPLSNYTIPANSNGYLAVSLTAATLNELVGLRPVVLREALVLCAALLFDEKYSATDPLPSPSMQLNVADYRSALDERLVDAVATFVGNLSSAALPVTSAIWPLTPGYAPLTCERDLLNSASLSRCYSTALTRANAAFATALVSTPGTANYCPPPPVRLQQLCVTDGQNLVLRLESAISMLPVERLRVVAYLDPLRAPANDVARDTVFPLAADAFNSTDRRVTTTAIAVRQVNDSFLAAVIFFYPLNVTMSSDAPLLLTAGDPTTLPRISHAVMLHNSPGEGVWERVAELLNISQEDVPLVSLLNGVTTACIAPCRTASGLWTVRGVAVGNSEYSTCPLRPWEPVLINEIDVDQPGLDDYEFIELKGSPGLDASGYSIEIVYIDKVVYVPLHGKFNSAGFFVIGTNKVANASMLFTVNGLLPNDGGAVAVYKTDSVQGNGLQDVVAFATSTDAAGRAAVGSMVAKKYPSLARSFLIEDASMYGGTASLSRCFCNATANHSCFSLSLRPTPGGENFCILRNQPLKLKFCLDPPATQLVSAAVKTALAATINSNCSCAFNEYQLSDMQQCDAGVQFDAFGTTSTHMDVIYRSFTSAIGRILSTPSSGQPLGMISMNCSLSCPEVTAPRDEHKGGSNGGVVAGVVISVLLLIAAGGVAVFWIRKRRADRGFQMARFDGAFEVDDAFAGDNASGRVTFSNPFRPSSSERRQYMKL